MKKIFVALSMVALLAACSGEGGNSTNPSDDESATLSSADGQGSSSSEKNVTNSSSSRCEECNDDAISSSGNAESSSSEKLSESSSSSAGKAKSSSSVVTLANPCKTETEDNCEYGELTDDRDGQTYKTVKIGDQWWMAENLNYETDNSFCFKDSAEYCEKYGRLYTWAAAMDSAGTWSTNGKGCGYLKTCSPIYPVRGVCPEGWHLPTQSEWNTLFTAVGGSSVACTKLKSTSGWNSNGNGTDAFSFSVLPAGLRYYDGDHGLEGDFAYFWSSTVGNSDYAHDVDLSYRRGSVALGYNRKSYGYSVRCVKD